MSGETIDDECRERVLRLALNSTGDRLICTALTNCVTSAISLIPDAEFRPIQIIDGHLALFGADPNALSELDKHPGEQLAAKV
jgi:hypothetical protein